MLNIKNILSLVRKNTRYFLAAAVLFLTFLINQSVFTKQMISSEDCAGGKCPAKDQPVPNLSDKNPFYYMDDIFKDKPEGYYRLTYKVKTDRASGIKLSMADYTEKQNDIKTEKIDSSSGYQNKESFFRLTTDYPNLVFEKENWKDGADLFIEGIKISKLSITSDEEMAALKPTVFGSVDPDVVLESQTNDAGYSFSWLKDPKTTIGQVFLAKNEYMTGVSLKIDVTKEINASSRQYTLALKGSSLDGNQLKSTGDTMASVKFSLANSLEKYRQTDGSFRFPLYAKLEKGKHYIITIDNSKVEPSESNFISVRGSKSDGSYSDGMAVFKKGKETYRIDGDWYFVIYGAEFSTFNETRVPSGATIEDVGKGKGRYSFSTRGKPADFFDVDSLEGVNFDSEKNILVGQTGKENFYTYAFHTEYPIAQISLKAQQFQADWAKVKISYSFDQKIWEEISSVQVKGESSENSSIEALDNEEAIMTDQENSHDSEEENSAEESDGQSENISSSKNVTLQRFDFSKAVTTTAKDIYIRIADDPENPEKAKYFGLKNFEFSAEFLRK